MVQPNNNYEHLIKMMASPPRKKDQNYWYMNDYEFLNSKVGINRTPCAGKAVNMADQRLDIIYGVLLYTRQSLYLYTQKTFEQTSSIIIIIIVM